MQRLLENKKALRAKIDKCIQLITQQPATKSHPFIDRLCLWATPKTHLKQYKHLHPSVRAQVNRLLDELKTSAHTDKQTLDCSDIADVEIILDRLKVFRQRLNSQIQNAEAHLKQELAKLNKVNLQHVVFGIEACVKLAEGDLNKKTLRC